RLGLLLAVSRGLDALPDVAVEQLDCTPGRVLDAGSVLSTEVHQFGQRYARLDKLQSRGDRLQVLGGIARLLAIVRGQDWLQQPGLVEHLEQRRRDPAACRELGKCESLRRRG